MANIAQLSRFANTIADMNLEDVERAHRLPSSLLLAQDADLAVYYAPFEYVNPQARVAIVGITPGFTQAINALREAQSQLRKGASHAAATQAAKETGAFSGSMRSALIAMLNHCGVQRWLGLSTCEELFSSKRHLLHTTSVLSNPVFVGTANYNGTPSMVRHPLLQRQLIEGFGQDTQRLSSAVYLPLGDKVAEALHFLAKRGCLREEQILDGMPHPSGANAERIAYFLGNKARAALSSKTNPDKLDRARTALQSRVAALA